jgi:uncharacterized protein (UPF0333 family)
MQIKQSKGNVVVEFLIYILFVITFLVAFIDFYIIAKNKSDMNKVANLISSSIGKNQENFIIWNNKSTKSSVMNLYGLQKFDYIVTCFPTGCSNYAEIVDVTIYGESSIVGFPFLLKVQKQSSISKFRVR